MGQPVRGRAQSARLVGATKHVAHPIGWIGLEYHVLDGQGRPKPGQHLLKLLVTSEEARDLSRPAASDLENAPKSAGTGEQWPRAM